jgi:hypothetical protein
MDFNSNVDSLNQFINNANQALTCGQECQQQQQTEQLQQSYNNALNNLETAPAQLQTAQQQYITYTQGAAGYQQFQTNSLQTTASQLASEYQQKFDGELKRANLFLDSYYGLLINYYNIIELNDYYTKENVELSNDIQYSTSDTVTNDRKTYYENQATESLNQYGTIFKVIYAIVVIAYGISCFTVPSNYPFKTKMLILVFLFIYPYISLWLSLKCITLYNFIISILPENQYKTL